MIIKPHTAICEDYDRIVKLCKETGEPVYLTVEDKLDLVVMDVDTFYKWEKKLEELDSKLGSESQK